MSDKSKKLYEIAYFLSSSIKEDDVLKHVQKLRELLEKHGGEITKEELPQIKYLAFPIKHERQGYFGYAHFKISSEKIKELSGVLKLTDDILRFLILKVTKAQIEQMTTSHINIPRKEQEKAEEAVESVLKEGAKSQVEEQKVELGELDEKLEELLNK